MCEFVGSSECDCLASPQQVRKFEAGRASPEFVLTDSWPSRATVQQQSIGPTSSDSINW